LYCRFRGHILGTFPPCAKISPAPGLISFMFVVVVVGRAHITHSGYSRQLGRWVPRRSPPSRRPRPLHRWMLPRWTCSRSMPRSLSQAALLVHSQRLRWRRWRGSRSYYRFSTARVLALLDFVIRQWLCVDTWLTCCTRAVLFCRRELKVSSPWGSSSP